MVETEHDAESTLKSFDGIHEAYAFFQRHSTESAACADVLALEIRKFFKKDKVFALADFGSGAGEFTSYLLQKLSVPPDLLKLTLIEPDQKFLRSAIAMVRPYTTHPIQAGSKVDPDWQPVDAVFSNHVLYYVPNLRKTVKSLLTLRSNSSRLFVTLASRKNSLIHAWDYLFSLLNESRPFHIADDLRMDLRSLGHTPITMEVCSELRFVDSLDNRKTILKFLLGQHFERFSNFTDPTSYFDHYKYRDEIVMPLIDEIFII